MDGRSSSFLLAHDYMDLEREDVGMATVTHARNVYLSELV